MENSSATWRKKVQDSWPYATAVTTILFLSCVLFAWIVTWKDRAEGLFSYVLAAADPALAAIGMLLVAIVFPDVYTGPRFRMPHLLTLPALYVVMIYALKSLARDSGTQLRRYENAERYDLIWLDPKIALAALLVLVLVMLGVGAIVREKGRVN